MVAHWAFGFVLESVVKLGKADLDQFRCVLEEDILGEKAAKKLIDG